MNIKIFLENILRMDNEAMAAAEVIAVLAARNIENSSLMEEYAQDLKHMEQKTAILADMIAALPKESIKQVFVSRYVRKLNWLETAESSAFSESQAKRLHNKGVLWLENNYKLNGGIER